MSADGISILQVAYIASCFLSERLCQWRFWQKRYGMMRRRKIKEISSICYLHLC